MRYPTVDYERGAVLLLDQTRLPHEVVQLRCATVEELVAAIRRLSVRGAPAIGVAAAHGVALAAHRRLEEGIRGEAFGRGLLEAIERLEASRPTAVNLHWALRRMRKVVEDAMEESVHGPADVARADFEEGLRGRLEEEAARIHREDQELCEAMGRHGAALLPDPAVVLTHCNTGALATAGIGTALGVVYAAARQGKKVEVYVDETRPLLQGARLNTWELKEHGIGATLICDGAAGWTLATRRIDAVLVGADRIARNGDVANKIGTYSLAVLAHRHGVPFYVVAPYSTLDFSLAGGGEIPIEERDGAEVTSCRGHAVALEGTRAFNPAFDVTPHELIAGIITERGVVRPPYEDNFRRLYATTTPDPGPPSAPPA